MMSFFGILGESAQQNQNMAGIEGFDFKIFSTINQGSLCEQWLAIRQVGSVAAYRKEFVEKVTAMGGVPEEIMLGAFVNGLNDQIKKQLRIFEPTSLKRPWSMPDAWTTRVSLTTYPQATQMDPPVTGWHCSFRVLLSP